MRAFFVQIKCELGKSYDVATAIADAEIASEIYSTAGGWDLLVKFYLNEEEDVGQFVSHRLQTIPGIRDTYTLITFKAFYRNVDRLFAHRVIRRSPHARQLPRGAEIAPVYVAAGREHDVASFMDRNVMVGILVIHRGQIVLERYGLGLQEHERWSTMSTVKSMTAMLVGAAVQDGAIKSIDDPLTDYLPVLRGSAYEGVTLRHVMTMSSGVRWTEVYPDRNSDVNRYSKSLADKVPDGVLKLMASLPRAHPPGSTFLYNSGDTFLLGAALTRAVGKPLADYMSEKVWQPAGMECDAFYTLESDGGQEIGGSRAGMVLRDFGRFAEFVRNDGVIDGTRVLPEGWVEAAATPAFKVPTPVVPDITHGSGRENDGKRNDRAERHAGQRIDADALQLLACLFGCHVKRLCLMPFLLLYLLRCLPEKQIGADRGAENRDQRGQIVALEGERRRQQRAQHLAPGNLHREHRADISEQGQRQPFQHAHIADIRNEHLQQHGHRAKGHYPQGMRAAGQQLHRVCHRREVSSDIDGVGHDQQRHHRIQQPWRIQPLDVRRQTFAGHAAYARRHRLYADHQRPGQQQRPQQLETELRAALRVGCDTARIIGSGAGDQSGAETLAPGRVVRCVRSAALTRAMGDGGRRIFVGHAPMLTPSPLCKRIAVALAATLSAMIDSPIFCRPC